MKLYVGNLSFNTSEDQIRELFAPIGEVESVNLIRDRATGQSRGFGFVELSDDLGRAACKALDQQEFEGRRLTVNEAKPQERRSGGFGGGRGGGGGGGFGRPKREARW
jgi:RNA recognition motif-containing protein